MAVAHADLTSRNGTIFGIPWQRFVVVAFIAGGIVAGLQGQIAQKAEKSEVAAIREQQAATLWLLCKRDPGDSVCRGVQPPRAP